MHKLRRKLILKLKGYQPKVFWNDWAYEFIKDPWQSKIHPQHKWLLKVTKKVNPRSILEVGCGFGRNIKFLIENGLNPASITGVDISSNMVRLAKENIDNKKVRLFASDLADFKPKNKFDLVFTHGVLMHIPKDRIGDAIDKLLALTKNDLVLIEQNYEADNNYTFSYDYKKLLSSKKIDIIEYRSDEKLGLDLIYAKVR